MDTKVLQICEYAKANGYSDGMRIFTKILKPVFGHLNQEGYLPVIFVDMTPIYKGTTSKSA